MKHKVRHVHFVGIGGAGMSGIAEVLFNLGYHVSGSDMGQSVVTQRLTSLGCKIVQGHAAEHVQGADALVISSAIKPDNPEVVAAHEQRIPVVPRAEMLGELMRLRKGIAIAGTHGKTTTTSLVTSILAEAGFDPTFVIGGRLNSVGANARLGTGDFIVAEADESDASFLHLMPVMSVITNIDADHMDTYGQDFGRLKQAFVDFAHRLPFYGTAVVCGDDPNIRDIIDRIARPVVTYGLTENVMVRAVDVQPDGNAMHFDVWQGRQRRLRMHLNLPGQHNVLNALAAIAIAWELGIDDEVIFSALKAFKGVGRRFTLHGDVQVPGGDGVFSVVDDYGHHPVEMAATLAAARGAYPGRRVVLAFQPHRYSRTRDCFEDFARVLSMADLVILGEVYAAGEQPIVAADARSLARAVRVQGRGEPIFAEHVADMAEAVRRVVQPDDVVICMGAGSVSQLPGLLTAAISTSH